jgi:hypothetical protein
MRHRQLSPEEETYWNAGCAQLSLTTRVQWKWDATPVMKQTLFETASTKLSPGHLNRLANGGMLLSACQACLDVQIARTFYTPFHQSTKVSTLQRHSGFDFLN